MLTVLVVRFRIHIQFSALLVAGCCVTSCGGSDEPSADEADTSEPEDVPEPELVELGEPLERSSRCIALQPNERVVSISPEGDVWLSAEPGATANYRVVGLDGSSQPVELEHATAMLQAWDTSRVTYLAEGLPWQSELDEGLTEPLFWPENLPAPTAACGDPTVDGDGFLAADEALLQRDAGLWWRWLTPAGENFGPVGQLATSYGACVDRQGALWLQTEAGEVWRVSADDAQSIAPFANAEALVFDVAGQGAGALIEGELVYGAPGEGWIIPQFSADPSEVSITGIAASAGRLWVASSRGLLSFDGELWSEVSIDGALATEPLAGAQLFADAGAAWLLDESAGELCRLEAGPYLAFAGLRPLQRVLEPVLQFEVLGPEAGALELLLDGELLTSTPGATTPWAVEAGLGEPGWHTLEVIGDAGPRRSVEIELRQPVVGTWIDDIQPLAELHCAGINGCHGPEVEGQGRPVLTAYEGWVLNADAIRARVGLSADMPPPANQLESWDAEEVSLILTWIEAGMPMGAG